MEVGAEVETKVGESRLGITHKSRHGASQGSRRGSRHGGRHGGRRRYESRHGA